MSLRLNSHSIRVLSDSTLEASLRELRKGSLPGTPSNSSFSRSLSYMDAIAFSKSFISAAPGPQQELSTTLAPESTAEMTPQPSEANIVHNLSALNFTPVLETKGVAVAAFGTKLGEGLGVEAFSNNGFAEERARSTVVLPMRSGLDGSFEFGRAGASASGVQTDSTPGSPLAMTRTDILSADPSQKLNASANAPWSPSVSTSEQEVQEEFAGWQWECLEYGRRWLIIRYGVSFPPMDGAHCLWEHKEFYQIDGGTPAPFIRYTNGQSNLPPSVGSLLIYPVVMASEMPYGHVAVVVDVSPTYVRVAEQNWDNKPWKHPTYSREIPLSFDPATKSYSITDIVGFPVLGWLDFNVAGRRPTVCYSDQDEFKGRSDQDRQQPSSIV